MQNVILEITEEKGRG